MSAKSSARAVTLMVRNPPCALRSQQSGLCWEALNTRIEWKKAFYRRYLEVKFSNAVEATKLLEAGSIGKLRV